MEFWCHLVVLGLVILTHGTMVRRSSKQHTDTKSTADHMTGGGKSGRRWRVVWWRWKWREPLIAVRERERERRVVGRLCKFFFTAGWRVNNGKMEGGVDARVGMARGGIGWIIRGTMWSPYMGHVFLLTFWADDVSVKIWTWLLAARQKCWEIVWRKKQRRKMRDSDNPNFYFSFIFYLSFSHNFPSAKQRKMVT